MRKRIEEWSENRRRLKEEKRVREIKLNYLIFVIRLQKTYKSLESVLSESGKEKLDEFRKACMKFCHELLYDQLVHEQENPHKPA